MVKKGIYSFFRGLSMGKTLLPVGSSGVLEIYHPSPDQSRLSKKPILGLNRQKKNKDHFTPILQHPSARYWQNYRYFQDVAHVIRQELTLKQPMSSHAQKIADDIEHCSSASIHFIRGDMYVNFVFSNERPLCLPIIDELFQGRQGSVTFVSGTADYEDLVLMSLCKHHTLANSTFSWWGAWLGKQKSMTIAPSKWINSPELPEEWHIVRHFIGARYLALSKPLYTQTINSQDRPLQNF
jgi:hypothetical protein